jgi:hypothetical protein
MTRARALRNLPEAAASRRRPIVMARLHAACWARAAGCAVRVDQRYDRAWRCHTDTHQGRGRAAHRRLGHRAAAALVRQRI